jgi:hypothetical protein
MSIVWPCPLAVDEYAQMGRAVRVPRPDCPSCLVPAVFWSGYWRFAREQGAERKVFIPRVRCPRCGATHAVLPAFALVRRLDAAESAGAVIGRVAAGQAGYQAGHQAAEHEQQAAAQWDRLAGSFRAQHAADQQASINALLLDIIDALASLFDNHQP